MDIILTVLGFAVLILSGDLLVRGAVNLGLRLGVPVLLISLTVVAFGTSAPELLIAIRAALEGAPGIALGNVIGSNIANILLVLGVPAVISQIATAECDSRKTYVFMLGATVICIALAYMGPFGIWHGVVLLALLGAMLGESYLSAQRHRANGANGAAAAGGGIECAPCDDLEVLEVMDESMPWWRIGLYILVGLVGLPLGSDMLLDGALGLARALGISETVIGLTLIAVGTSLPELATTVMAAIRRHGDVVLGNVIGSNMFNLLGIMGVASFFGPLEVPASILSFDLWVMLGTSLLILPFVFWHLNLNRAWGVALCSGYALYVVLLLG